MFSSSAALCPHPIQLDRELLDLVLELGAVILRLRGFHLLSQIRFHDTRVGNQALGDIEAQQRLDRRAQHLAARLIFSQRADLLGVKKEELRDFEREEVLDELVPVLGMPAVDYTIQQHAELLAHLAALHVPGSTDVINMLFTARGIPEGERDAGPFALVDAVVDRLAEELVVRQAGPLRAARTRPVKRELDRVEQRRLAGAVDPAEQHDPPRARVARCGQRSEVEGLFAAEEAEVPQRHVLQNHSDRPDGAS